MERSLFDEIWRQVEELHILLSQAIDHVPGCYRIPWFFREYF